MSFLELICIVKWVNDPNVWFWSSNKQEKGTYKITSCSFPCIQGSVHLYPFWQNEKIVPTSNRPQNT